MNTFFADRTKLKPNVSARSLIQYALLEDAKTRSRYLRNQRASAILTILILSFPSIYILKGMFYGCWNDVHGPARFSLIFQPFGSIWRSFYRPEIYMREKQAHLYRIEKENIEKEKEGEKPSTTSPIVLWH